MLFRSEVVERGTLTVAFYKHNVAQAKEFLFFLACEKIVNARCTVNCLYPTVLDRQFDFAQNKVPLNL